MVLIYKKREKNLTRKNPIVMKLTQNEKQFDEKHIKKWNEMKRRKYTWKDAFIHFNISTLSLKPSPIHRIHSNSVSPLPPHSFIFLQDFNQSHIKYFFSFNCTSCCNWIKYLLLFLPVNTHTLNHKHTYSHLLEDRDRATNKKRTEEIVLFLCCCYSFRTYIFLVGKIKL